MSGELRKPLEAAVQALLQMAKDFEDVDADVAEAAHYAHSAGEDFLSCLSDLGDAVGNFVERTHEVDHAIRQLLAEDL